MGKINIYKCLNIFRKCWPNTMKMFIKMKNYYIIVAIDESLFLHNNFGKKEWLIRLIDIQTRKIRLEIVNERTEQIIKKIIKEIVIMDI